MDFWSSAAGFYMGATEAERFGSLDDIARDSSVAVLARVVSPGPSRVIAGDEGTEDVLVYESVIVEILDVMSGHMSEAHQIGDLLVLEQVGTPPEDAIGTTAVLFLRDKQDMFGFPSDAEPRPEEEGLYRLVSSQGVFIDRGDGVAVNPIIEMVRFMRSGEPGTFTDFVFDDSISINQDTYPVAAVARQMTLTELIDLIASMGE
ncbi:MAG: hypothetical protein R3258_02695 [Acidimicrobiia bacterium]|nr:hypothetical protein [Acidimicrobiia bacterium]